MRGHATDHGKHTSLCNLQRLFEWKRDNAEVLYDRLGLPRRASSTYAFYGRGPFPTNRRHILGAALTKSLSDRQWQIWRPTMTEQEDTWTDVIISS